MASPKLETFVIFDASGNPLTGVTPTFTYYKTSSGGTLTPPAISEVGTTGIYTFTPVFADTTKGIHYIVSTGYFPLYYSRYMRPEDYTTDVIPNIQQFQQGDRELKTTGPDANHEIIYDADGTTVLKKYALTDNSSNPSVAAVFKKTGV